MRPWLISGRAELGGLMVFIGVLGGIAAFGLLGVVLGPIVVAMVASLLEVYAPTRARLETEGSCRCEVDRRRARVARFGTVNCR